MCDLVLLNEKFHKLLPRDVQCIVMFYMQFRFMLAPFRYSYWSHPVNVKKEKEYGRRYTELCQSFDQLRCDWGIGTRAKWVATVNWVDEDNPGRHYYRRLPLCDSCAPDVQRFPYSKPLAHIGDYEWARAKD